MASRAQVRSILFSLVAVASARHVEKVMRRSNEAYAAPSSSAEPTERSTPAERATAHAKGPRRLSRRQRRAQKGNR